MFRTTRALAITAVLALALTACGDDQAESTETTAAPVASEPSATEPVATDAATDTTAAAESDGPVAERIVSLSSTATEMLFAIGAGDQVIAVDDQSNYPAEAQAKMTDLSGFTPNIEAIASYEPDLVVIGDDSQDISGQLDTLGIEVWLGPAAESFDDIYVQIEELGAMTGHVDEGVALVGDMQSDISAAVDAVPEISTPLRYYHELDNTFYSANSNTFIGQVYGLYGLQNIADTAEGAGDYPQLSPEFIISQDPDLIFLADTKCCGETPETVAARPGWGKLTAVTTGGVIGLDDDIVSRWGPRVVDYVEIVGAAVAEIAVLSAG
jgi:iron complex transport system substrate-binding protein